MSGRALHLLRKILLKAVGVEAVVAAATLSGISPKKLACTLKINPFWLSYSIVV